MPLPADTGSWGAHASLCAQVLYSLASDDPVLKRCTAAALARLVKDADLRMVFLDRKGLDILIEPLKDGSSRPAALEAACAHVCVRLAQPAHALGTFAIVWMPTAGGSAVVIAQLSSVLLQSARSGCL